MIRQRRRQLRGFDDLVHTVAQTTNPFSPSFGPVAVVTGAEQAASSAATQAKQAVNTAAQSAANAAKSAVTSAEDRAVALVNRATSDAAGAIIATGQRLLIAGVVGVAAVGGLVWLAFLKPKPKRKAGR